MRKYRLPWPSCALALIVVIVGSLCASETPQPAAAIANTLSRGLIAMDGVWKFVPGADAPANASSDQWGEIKIPGNWNRAKDAHITRTGKGDAWKDFNGETLSQAWYQRSVTIPLDWAGRTILLDLDRVSTDADVYVNGTKAGSVNWPGGSVDITNQVKPGSDAQIRLKVIAVDDRKDVEVMMGYLTNEKQAAKLDFRGVIGSVSLISQPAGAHVADVFVRPSTRTKKLNLDIELEGLKGPSALKIVAEALDETGKVEKTFSTEVNAQGDGVIPLSFDWPDARWWDVGQPNLYSLRVSVEGNGLVDTFVVPRFGFREFWIEGRKLFLNNTEIRLRPAHSERSPKELLEFGYNYIEKPGDFARRGTDYKPTGVIEASDRVGLLLGVSAGQWTEIIANWGDTEKRADWEKITEREIRRVRNFPSVVSWTHSFNGFQWPGDGDPRFLGKKDFVAIQEYENRNKLILEAIKFVKSLNGDMPVYAHFGTYNGDIYTSNFYLNFLPLQEREEWLSHWVKEGDMPWMACEFGLPLYCNSNRGRDGYSHQGVSEPLNTEWMASFIGNDSYTLEDPAYRQLIRDRYKGQNIQAEYEPHLRWDKKDELIWKSASYDRMLTDFITKTFRSWRTMGMTAGAVPWHSDSLPALKAVNGPTLAWISGAGGLPGETADGEAFTSKDHNYDAGSKVEKQAVVINDTRSEQPYQIKWEAKVGDTVVGSGEKTGTLRVSETHKIPIEFQLPKEIQSKTDASIALTATIGSAAHEDTFPFRVFPPEPLQKGTIAVFDPEGRTTAMLKSLGYTVTEWTQGTPDGALAVVGRKALSSKHQLPDGWRKFVEQGGRLLIEAQDPRWMKYALDLRSAPYVSRKVFRLDKNHSVVAGLDETDLSDWRGHGTLVESHPTYAGFNTAPEYGWRWGNRGSVTSAPIEKPHRTSWRPILENEFDLAYTPLMEMEAGKGRIIFCTLDIEDAVAKDPAARKLAAQIVEYAKNAPIQPKAENVLYLGGKEGAELLDFLTVKYSKATAPDPSAGLVIVGADANPDKASLEAYAKAGGRVLFLPRADDRGWGDVKTVKRASFKGSLTPPAWPEAAGLNVSDLRWRNEADGWALEAEAPVEIGADGLLARRKVGNGVLVYTQLTPNAVPADAKSYFRYTRWRQTRALSQVLANLGASFKNDDVFLGLLAQPKPAFMLAGEWDVKLTNAVPESPTRKWNANPGISKEALQFTKPGVALEGFEKQRVPSYIENYGGKWRYTDGEVVYHKEFALPDYWAGKDLFIALGRVDEEETTFFNGEKIASSDHWVLPRGHVIPGKHVVAGKNLLTIVSWDRGIHGGWHGDPDLISLRAAAEPSPFYHPDFRNEDMEPAATTEAQWRAKQELRAVGDNPYRYYRW